MTGKADSLIPSLTPCTSLSYWHCHDILIRSCGLPGMPRPINGLLQIGKVRKHSWETAQNLMNHFSNFGRSSHKRKRSLLRPSLGMVQRIPCPLNRTARLPKQRPSCPKRSLRPILEGSPTLLEFSKKSICCLRVPRFIRGINSLLCLRQLEREMRLIYHRQLQC